ncbi:hypothetical protein KC571_00320 [candidate division WWE3 bacterium]|uniref:IPT/TIG domain-containing protein n=1 Tax=candidate division WWE3 bacterium TaxID=2053526 RepID=A0A955LG68_UNCKA|nr:hypothetical protein [candidate division WWE3 bacterium]
MKTQRKATLTRASGPKVTITEEISHQTPAADFCIVKTSGLILTVKQAGAIIINGNPINPLALIIPIDVGDEIALSSWEDNFFETFIVESVEPTIQTAQFLRLDRMAALAILVCFISGLVLGAFAIDSWRSKSTNIVENTITVTRRHRAAESSDPASTQAEISIPSQAVPIITGISPSVLRQGQTLTIYGENLRNLRALFVTLDEIEAEIEIERGGSVMNVSIPLSLEPGEYFIEADQESVFSFVIKPRYECPIGTPLEGKITASYWFNPSEVEGIPARPGQMLLPLPAEEQQPLPLGEPDLICSFSEIDFETKEFITPQGDGISHFVVEFTWQDWLAPEVDGHSHAAQFVFDDGVYFTATWGGRKHIVADNWVIVNQHGGMWVDAPTEYAELADFSLAVFEWNTSVGNTQAIFECSTCWASNEQIETAKAFAETADPAPSDTIVTAQPVSAAPSSNVDYKGTVYDQVTINNVTVRDAGGKYQLQFDVTRSSIYDYSDGYWKWFHYWAENCSEGNGTITGSAVTSMRGDLFFSNEAWGQCTLVVEVRTTNYDNFYLYDRYEMVVNFPKANTQAGPPPAP